MDDSVLDIVRKFSESVKPIASICHGQLVLAAADVVKGRKCTAYPSVKPVVVAAGCQWIECDTAAKCVKDGNLITGVTFEGLPEFIRLFVGALGGTITGADKRVLFLCGVRTFSLPFTFIMPMIDRVCRLSLSPKISVLQ